jgi:hypothetical protein
VLKTVKVWKLSQRRIMKRKKSGIKILFNIPLWILLFATCNSVMSQQTDFGIGAGGVLYWGDLTPKSPAESLKNLRFGMQGFLRSEISPSFATRVNLMIGRLNGDDQTSIDEGRNRRNLRFNATIVELALMGEYSFLKFDLTEFKDGLSFYLAGGLNVFYFNPTTDYQGNTYSLQPLGTEGQGMPGFPDRYSRVAIGLPLGGGMKIRLSENLTLNPEFIARITFTDYLDDVSGFYVNYFELQAGNGDLAATLANRSGEYLGLTEPVIVNTGAQRGGPNADDFYFVGMINLTYKISNSASLFSKGKKKYNSDCPTF